MNGQVAEVSASRSQAVEVGTDWRTTLFAGLFLASAILVLYAGTFLSIVSIWMRSDTFAHGFFIVPISLYVAWTERDRIARRTPRPEARPLVLILPLGVGWLASRLGNVLVMEQYFAVAMSIVAAWCLLGSPLARKLAFPLGFLFLAVPVGEGLLPYLIDATTVFTVTALRLSGVAVLQHGNQLTLSNGVWSVVEACSGLRYLIACVTIGLPFAYLTYRSIRRRALFVGASIAVPIVANWLRAYMVVMIGYLSDMKLAVSIDHLIYGWIFYAVVMFLLLWVGARFAEPRDVEEGSAEEAVPQRVPPRRTPLVAAAVLVAVGVWPVWAALAKPDEDASVGFFELPRNIGSFAARGSLLTFEPRYAGPDVVEFQSYEGLRGRVTLHVSIYARQVQGRELVGSTSTLLSPDDPVWRELERGRFAHELVRVDERIAASEDSRLLIWKWYWIGGRLTSSPVWAKTIESGRRLMGEETPGAGIVVYTSAAAGTSAARETLSAFVTAMMPELDARLSEATAR